MPEEKAKYVVYNGEKVFLKGRQVTSRSKIKNNDECTEKEDTISSEVGYC